MKNKKLFHFSVMLICMFALTACSSAPPKVSATPQPTPAIEIAKAEPTPEPAPETAATPEPSPTPEPIPPITDFCARMESFGQVMGDVKDMDKAERREYNRLHGAFVSALRYKLQRNPYSQFSGCGKGGYGGHWKEFSPSNYLTDYADVIPRTLLLRALRPEVADRLRELRRTTSYTDIVSTRVDFRSIRNSYQLNKREMLSLGMTSREILEAEINFKASAEDQEIYGN